MDFITMILIGIVGWYIVSYIRELELRIEDLKSHIAFLKNHAIVTDERLAHLEFGEEVYDLV